MQVLIIAPYRTVAPHFETELEIAQRHRDAGDTVTFVSCLGELPACDFNPKGDQKTCHECRLRRLHGIDQVSPGCSQLPLVRLNETDDSPVPDHCLDDIETLKRWTWRNFDVGYACLSSLVSMLRDPEPDLREHREQLNRFAAAALATYRGTLKTLANYRPDRVYVFNGRFSTMRAVLRACEAARVDCHVHERGCDRHHFQVFKNHLPHDIDRVEQRMRAMWHRAATKPHRYDFARRWYQGRVARVEMNWRSFVTDQTQGTLPANWDPARHNIAVFTSSEDEFVAIGDSWSNRLYGDQAKAIVRLARDLAKIRPRAHLTVRIHPNLAGIDNASTRRLQAISEPNVTMIPAEYATDSYHLMRMADTVATFGSSIGIEAVYWGKPSVLLGPCFYRNLAGPRRARSHAHATRLLASNLMPVLGHEALIYGLWQQCHGLRFQYFEATDLFVGKFKGMEIWPKPRPSIRKSVQRRIASVRKRMPLGGRRAA